MAEAILSLGGNVGAVRATLDRAVTLLCDGQAVHLLARSSDYRSAPWGNVDQPAYVNLCLIVTTMLAPRALLAHAEAIEVALGRDRAHEQRWGPRPIDIDIVAYDDLATNDPDFVLPHPFWYERAFVLLPLSEIAPDRVINGIAVRDALLGLDCSDVQRLPPSQKHDSEKLADRKEL